MKMLHAKKKIVGRRNVCDDRQLMFVLIALMGLPTATRIIIQAWRGYGLH